MSIRTPLCAAALVLALAPGMASAAPPDADMAPATGTSAMATASASPEGGSMLDTLAAAPKRWMASAREAIGGMSLRMPSFSMPAALTAPADASSEARRELYAEP